MPKISLTVTAADCLSYLAPFWAPLHPTWATQQPNWALLHPMYSTLYMYSVGGTAGPSHYKSSPLHLSPPVRLGRTPYWVSQISTVFGLCGNQIILTTAPVFFHDLSFIYILRNNSLAQEQSEKIVISSLRVNDTVENLAPSLTILWFTRTQYSTFSEIYQFSISL